MPEFEFGPTRPAKPDRRFHAIFWDQYSGEELGLILKESPQVGINRRLINPYAAKTGQGNAQYSDLTEWTVVAQDDWRGGRGQDVWEDQTSYADAGGVETRIEGQLTLGPKPIANASDFAANQAAPDGHHLFGRPYQEVCNGSTPSYYHGLPWPYWNKLGQQVAEPYRDETRQDGVRFLESIELLLWKQEAFPDESTITVLIYKDEDGLPGSAPIASKGVSVLDVPQEAWTWVKFEWDSAVSLLATNKWWIVLEVSGHEYAPGNNLRWGIRFGSPYPAGVPAFHDYWGEAGWSIADAHWDRCFKANWCNTRLSQSFRTTDQFTAEDLYIYGAFGWRHARVGLYTNVAKGDPEPDTLLTDTVIGPFETIYVGFGSTTTLINTIQKTTQLEPGMWVNFLGVGEEYHCIEEVTNAWQFRLYDPLPTAPPHSTPITPVHHASSTPAWRRARLPDPQVLAADTLYHIVVEQTDKLAEAPSALPNGWGQISHGGTYDDGDAYRQYKADDQWHETGTDLLFRVNDLGLAGAVTHFARFKDEWYCASGHVVYRYNPVAQSWASVDATLVGHVVTGLVSWGGYLWAARADDANLRRSADGDAWADWAASSGVIEANLLHVGGGYLSFTGAGSDKHIIYYTWDGTDYQQQGEVGVGDYPVTALAVYRDTLFATTATRLWNVNQQDWPFPVLDWSAQEHEDNGRGMTPWNRDNCLYIPLRYGLYRWNGDSMLPTGPERRMGLPEERAGTIVDLCATNNWLYAAIDAGPNKTSSVLCYNGMGGWSEMARGDKDERITALGFSTIHSPSQLWYGVGAETRYLPLPDRSDNPWQWTGDYEFNPSGELVTSWFGHDLMEVNKNIHEVVIRGEGISEDTAVDVYLEVDRSDLLVYWGRFDRSPRQSIMWGQHSWHRQSWRQREIGAGSTATRIVLSGEGIRPGDFVRINGDASQVKSVKAAFVELTSALSEAPGAGDTMYASQPIGRLFRLHLILYAENGMVTKTPRVQTILVRYQNNVLDRYLWTLQVNCRPSKDLSGAEYPMTAAELRQALDQWATRQAPFTLIDQDGREHTVKVSSAGEGGLTRLEEAAGAKEYRSTYNFNLVEVA